MASYLDLLRDGDFEIVPYHGRDYCSPEQAVADWNANKDFIIRASGSMTISKSEAEMYCRKGAGIYIRFNKLRDVTVVRV